MNLTRWEPFREMEDLLRRYSPFFARTPLEGRESNEWIPAADISETDKEYLIKAELPAVKKEEVKITLQDGVLTIAGERKHEKEQRGENEIRVESCYGRFLRSFTLPDNVDMNNIRAESQDGVLRIHVPKTASTQSKPISIDIK